MTISHHKCATFRRSHNLTLLAHLTHARHRNTAERAQHISLHPRRRLEHKDASGTQQVHRDLREIRSTSDTHSSRHYSTQWAQEVMRDLGVDLHGEEEPEAGVRLHGVKLLLQLHQPTGSQMNVLQHHPPDTQTHVRSRDQQTRPIRSVKGQLISSHLPDFTAVLMSLSALLKPSAEPEDGPHVCYFTKPERHSRTEQQILSLWCLLLRT